MARWSSTSPCRIETPTQHSQLDSLRPVACSTPAQPTSLPTDSPRLDATRKARLSNGLLNALAGVATAVLVAGFAAPPRRGATPQAPHAAAPAVKKSADGNAVRWHAPSLALTLDPSLGSLGPGAKDAVRKALGAWLQSDSQLPQVTFDDGNNVPGTVAMDGVNRVLAGPIDLPGHENDLALTTTYSDSETGAILEADIVFNTRHAFFDAGTGSASGDGEADSAKASGNHDEHASNGACEGRYDLQNIATHEMGHFFGLGEDYTEQRATMFVSSRPCETSKRQLFSTDSAAIDQLYQGGLGQNQPGVACSTVAAGGYRVGWQGVAAALAAVLVAGAARRKR